MRRRTSMMRDRQRANAAPFRDGRQNKRLPLAPAIFEDVLGAPGRPLDPSARMFMEPQFGHDFSSVRIHDDAKAAQSVRAIGAIAYTAGRHIALAGGVPDVRTRQGRSLLGHELTHVIQQRHSSTPPAPRKVSPVDHASEREADAASAVNAGGFGPVGPITARPGGQIQRTVTVEDASKDIPNPGGKGVKQTNAETIENYLSTLCASGGAAVDGKSGKVSIPSSFCTVPALPKGALGPLPPTKAESSATATGCTCICDLVASKNPWKIRVNDADWPHTLPDDNDKAIGKKPGGSSGYVTAPSPNSPKIWGAAEKSGKRGRIDPWLVLGHELCGHAWLANSGKGGPDQAKSRGEGGHQETVARENLLRQEHGLALRGTHKDPLCGESFSRDKAKPGKIKWSIHLKRCKKWRKAYNRKHGTKYTIYDKMP